MEQNLQKSVQQAQPMVAVAESSSGIRFRMGDAISSLVLGFIIGIFAPVILGNVGKTLPLQDFYYIIFPLLTFVGVWITYLIASKIPVLIQIVKFGTIGVANTVIDFGVLNFLSVYANVFSGVEVVPLNAISFTVAVVNSYFWNKYWAFKSNRESSGKQFVEFVVVSLIGISINTGIVYLATTYSSSFAVGMPEKTMLNIAKLGATFASLLWNFVGYKFIVFKK